MSIATAEPVANGETSGAAIQKQPAAEQVPVTVQRQPLVYVDEGEFSALLDTAKFGQLQRVANLFAASTIVPEHFQNNVSNCFIGLQMAIRLNVDPFMFLQSCYIVHGRPGIEAKLAIALANASGKFKGPIRYKMQYDPKTGKPVACTASATFKETGDVIETTVNWAMVEAEGWNKDKENKKTGWVQKSKWNTIPEIMFQYRSAMFLLKTNCPEVIMGMQSKDELEDEFGGDGAPKPVLQMQPVSLDALTDRLMAHQHQAPKTAAVESRTAAEESQEDADPMIAIESAFADVKDQSALDALYDDLKGPSSTVAWTDKQSDEIEHLRLLASQRLNKTKKQGTLT